jgi:hypothetical protein
LPTKRKAQDGAKVLEKDSILQWSMPYLGTLKRPGKLARQLAVDGSNAMLEPCIASNTQPEYHKIQTLDDLLTKDSSSPTAGSKDSGSGLELSTVAGLRLLRNH